MGLKTELDSLYHIGHECIHANQDCLIPDLSDLTELFESLAKQAFENKGKGEPINRELYDYTGKRLAEAMMKGLGNMSEYTAEKALLKAKFENNIYAFSAAKNITQYKLMANALTDEQGKQRTFNMFREAVEKINPLFNEQYLKAEYTNAISQAEAAAQWTKFDAEKDKFPYLIFQTMEDDRVRASHAALNGVKRPVNDQFWDKHRPPLDWGCRCWLVQTDEPRYNTPFKEAITKGKAANIKPYFKNNKANQGVIFKEDMTYFKNISDPQKLDAVKNYGMKTYEQVKREAKMYAPEIPKAQTKEEFLEWWEATSKGESNFTIFDKNGNSILLDADAHGQKESFTREHIAQRGHFTYGRLVVDCIENADEAWSFIDHNLKAKPITLSYLKYYKDKIIVTIARETNGTIKAITSYEVTDGKLFSNLRKGILLNAKKRH